MQVYLFELLVRELGCDLNFVPWENPFKIDPEQIVKRYHDAKQLANKHSAPIITIMQSKRKRKRQAC